MRNYLRYRKAKRRLDRLNNLKSTEVLRDFLLDSRMYEAQQLSTLLGLPEITEDDTVASEERARRVAPFVPLIAYFASTLSTGVMEYYDTVSPWNSELTDDEKVAMETWIAKISMACVLGTLTQFEAMDLIRVNR